MGRSFFSPSLLPLEWQEIREPRAVSGQFIRSLLSVAARTIKAKAHTRVLNGSTVQFIDYVLTNRGTIVANCPACSMSWAAANTSESERGRPMI